MAESKQLREQGKIEMQLLEDDALIFDKILEIIHGNSILLTPEESHIEFLIAFAIVVDKYGFFECTHELATTWAEVILAREKNSDTACHNRIGPTGRDYLYWVCI
jgi:hypothetical protein